MSIQLPECWLAQLRGEFDKPYMQQLKAFLQTEKKLGKIIFPANAEIFSAFHLTHWKDLKIVILGQDPYHGQGQAHGLAFSVKKGVPVPPSLKNIYKELQNNFPDYKIPNHGNLSYWAQQGVLMLNATLTVEANKAGSHQNKGWEIFTDCVIQKLNNHKKNLIFMLWGNYAQKKAYFIDESKHLVMKSAHPSPLGAHKGFWNQMHFKKANGFLEKQQLQGIDWQII